LHGRRSTGGSGEHHRVACSGKCVGTHVI
jgi:hypothetical protein